MAKVSKGNKTKRQQVNSALRRHGARAKAVASKVNLTLGDLIAAAFDAVGSESKTVAQVLSSRDMTRRTHCKLIFV